MSEKFYVQLSQIVRTMRQRSDSHPIHVTTLRGMCARPNGALARYAQKNGHAWELPAYVAEDFITNYKPYGNPPWRPSIATTREYNRRKRVDTQTAQPSEL